MSPTTKSSSKSTKSTSKRSTGKMAEQRKRSEAAKKAARTRARAQKQAAKSPADKIRRLVDTAVKALDEAQEIAYTTPEASSVRPPISEARRALTSTPFTAQVGRIGEDES